MAHLSDSKVQRELEAVALTRACDKLGLSMDHLGQGHRVRFGDGASVTLDGWWDDGESVSVAMECYVSLGAPKSAQGNKLRADILKLEVVRRMLEQPQLRCCIVVTSTAAEAWLRKGWVGHALRILEVEVVLITLTTAERRRLARARDRQRRGMAGVS